MNIISLGSNCSVCYHLKELGLRKEAYPFDWCKINLKSLVNILKNNFKDFERLSIKKFSDKHPLFDTNKNNGSLIIKNIYGVEFAHEVLDKYQLEEFSKKLLERIERFKNSSNPILVRIEVTPINPELYNELIQLLDGIFTDYKLVIISKQNINNPKIINYQLDNYEKDWKYPSVDWLNIFTK